MYNKEQVISKLNALLAYSCGIDAENAATYQTLMQPLLTAVNVYFNANRSAFKVLLNDLELALYNDIMKRHTVFSNGGVLPMDVDYPAAYNDLRKLFYTFQCMDVSDAAFHAAWVKGTDEITQLPVVTNNTLIDEWIAALKTAVDDELTNINTFYNWLSSAASNAGMIMLWENTGQIMSQPNIKEVAEDIFIDKHFKECIDTLNLPAYKPSYI